MVKHIERISAVHKNHNSIFDYCKTLIIREKFIFANIREFSKTRIHISREYFTLSIHLSENEHYPKMRTHAWIYISAGKYRNQF
jgi:hypothetical protein